MSKLAYWQEPLIRKLLLEGKPHMEIAERADVTDRTVRRVKVRMKQEGEKK